MKSIDYKEVIKIAQKADLYKGTQIFRWSTRNAIKTENDCEHQNIVSQLTMILCEIFEINEITYKEAVCLASIHDMFEYAEGGMGDIPHSVKMESLEINRLVEQHEENTILKIPYFGKIWDNARSNPLAYDIVMLADALDVILFIDREFNLGNNDEDFKEIYKKSQKRIKTCLNAVLKDMEYEN